MTGCNTPGNNPPPVQEPDYQAQRTEMVEAQIAARGVRDAEVLQLGADFLAYYPDHDLADAVSARMIASAVRLPDLDLALDLARAFPDRYPNSVRRDQALTTAARGLAAGDRGADAVRVLARLADDQSGAALSSPPTVFSSRSAPSLLIR